MSSPPPLKGSKRQRIRNVIRHGLDAILPSPRSTSPNPGAGSITWTGLEKALRVLEGSADALPPLKSAVGGLIACLEIIRAATSNHEEYQQLTSELTAMAGILNQYMTRSFEAEVEYLTQKQGRGKGRRMIESSQNQEDVTKRYRRIEGLFRQLQSDVSLRAWETTDKHFKMSLLERMSPADDALYNSSYSTTIKRRGCTAETREKVQADIQDWVRDPNAAKVYWMNGMAGTGKTTIAYSLCEWLEANQLLGASFFCSRISSSCRNVSRIIPTIAYQLAHYSPAFRSALCKAMEEKMNASKLNVVWQFKQLVQEPVQKVKGAMPDGVVVVIDALDECDDTYGVRLVLETLLKFASDLPLKFFVTSRPEPAIRNKMLSPGEYSPTVLHLHDIEESIVEEDIKKYLTETLNSMSPVPSTDQIARLAKRAGKLFIYAATAVRYILPDDMDVNSNARLEAMLETAVQTSTIEGPNMKYQELDALYTDILANAFNPQRREGKEIRVIQLVLWTIVCAKEPMTTPTIASLLGIAESEVSSALQPLRSVLHISEAGGVVSTLHASFVDFIFDRARSTSFYCEKVQHNELLAHRCFDNMEEHLRFNICNLESSCRFDKDVPDIEERIRTCISPALFYACRYWGAHLQLGSASDELSSQLVGLLTQRLLYWMEILNLGQCIVMGSDILLQAQDWLSAHDAAAETKRQASDAQIFVARFAAGSCKRSTPHIYISALPFCPRSSSVYKSYWGRTQGILEMKGTAIAQREKAALVTWITDSMVRTTAFSPEGTCIVSGSDDGGVRVWDARTSDLIVGPLEGHAGQVFSVKFSPNGSRIASSSNDRTIRVWDARTGDIAVGPLEGHTGIVWSVAFSPDGSRIGSGSGDRTIRLWDARTGNEIAKPFAGHTGEVNSVSFSPDGTRIASGSDDKTIRVWDVFTGDVLAGPFEGHTDIVRSVAFSPDGSRVASGSSDHTVRLWDVRTDNVVCANFEGHTDQVRSVAFSPDGSRIVSGSDDDTIQVWDVISGSIRTGIFEGHTDWVHSVAFSPDGSRIVSGSPDRTIRVWDARLNHSVFGAFHGHGNSVTSVAFSPDGASIVSGSGDQTIRVWDVRTGSPIMKTQDLHTDAVYTVAFSPDGTRIASCSDDHTIRVWGARGGETLAGPFKRHDGGLNSVVFSLDGSRIVSGSDDCTIRVWDSNTGDTLVGPLKGHSQRVMSVALSPDNTRIVSGSHDNTIRMWDAETGDTVLGPLEGHAGGVNSVAFSPDGTHIVSGSSDHTVRAWNAQTGTAIAKPFEGHTDRVNSVAFSPDGTLIISGSSDCTVRLWNPHTGDPIAGPFQGHTAHVFSVAFSPGGSLIVSGSGDHAIRVWNIGDAARQKGGHANSVQFDAPSLTNTQAVSRLENDLNHDQPDPSINPDNLTSVGQSHIHNGFAGTADFTSHNDGWITTDGIPLLWIPPDFRHHLPYPHNSLVIGHQGSAYVDYRNLLIGERWAECYIPE